MLRDIAGSESECGGGRDKVRVWVIISVRGGNGKETASVS